MAWIQWNVNGKKYVEVREFLYIFVMGGKYIEEVTERAREVTKIFSEL